MTRYRKRPVVVEARQFCGGGAGSEGGSTQSSTSHTHAIYQWIEKNTLGSFEPMDVIEGRKPWPASGVTIDPRDGRMVIATLEGGHWVNLFDWVIRGVKGEFYPCKPDIFEATYELAESRQPTGGPMRFNEYQRATQSTAIYPDAGTGSTTALAYIGLGLGEAGEVQGKIKKVLRDDAGVVSEEKRSEIAAELGDLLWYVARLAEEIGYPLDNIAEANLAKLYDRKNRNVLKGSGDHR